FNDPGMNMLYRNVIDKISGKTGADLNSSFERHDEMSEKIFVIPPKRVRYLSEIADNNRNYDQAVEKQVGVAQKLYGICMAVCSVTDGTDPFSLVAKAGLDGDELMKRTEDEEKRSFLKLLLAEFDRVKMELDPHHWETICNWKNK